MSPPPLAAFDLDGTLTRGDVTFALLRRRGGLDGLARAALAEAAALVRLARARDDDAVRQATKAAVLARLLRGMPATTFERLADQVAASATGAIGRQPLVVRRLRWHQRQGHDVVVVSASPAPLVQAVVRRLDVAADHVVATELAVDEHGRLTGALAGANCRGPEKVVRVAAWVDGRGLGEPQRRFAYGDSSGDLPLLAGWATDGFRVRRSGRLVRVAPAGAGSDGQGEEPAAG